ncbi:MAG: hypothetical protein L0J45_05465, partial [Psychroflexus sp.]|nr:hypothetical protein [Psychroflexus sp.]
MKINLSNLALLILIATTMACSDDDSVAHEYQVRSYFNLAADNSWTYNNTYSSENKPPQDGSETLIVDELTTENGKDFYQLKSTNIEVPGLTTSFLTSGKLAESEDQSSLFYTGDFNLSILEQLPEINIDVQELKLYDQNLSTGTNMFLKDEVINQTISDIPLTISVEVYSNYLGNLGSKSVNGETYTNVIASEIIVKAKVTSSLAFTTITVLEQQDFFKATLYFAPQIGLIKSDAMIEATFEDLSSFGLPL